MPFLPPVLISLPQVIPALRTEGGWIHSHPFGAPLLSYYKNDPNFFPPFFRFVPFDFASQFLELDKFILPRKDMKPDSDLVIL